MKISLLYTVSVFAFLLMPHINFGQAPNLGSTAGFALFTAAGAFSNTGLSVVGGDVGTDVGAFTGFPPGIVNGQIYVQDAVSAQAAIDVDVAFMDLASLTCGAVLGVNLGNNQTLTPNVYCISAAATLNGDLVLDGQCDPNAIFVIQIDGALATGIISNVLLTNSASLCNVYWQVNGAVSLGDNSVFRGTVVANGAISLLDGATLLGRGLTREGAIALHNNIVDFDMQPTASVIIASGATTFCAGGSVVLSTNCGGTWSNGATSPTLTVTTSGDYFLTTANGCGSAVSNHIVVTVVSLPICTITGNISFCDGGSTELCTPVGAASYLWSTGASTRCITVAIAGNYAVTVTGLDGCSSVCNTVVTENVPVVCTITGNTSFCDGGSTELCTPVGAASYLWSTGASTRCITVAVAGNYAVTVTGLDGCSSVCNTVVTENVPVVCTITGNTSFCDGGSTELCTPVGAASYLWSTGASTRCITVAVAGNYAVTVTGLDGCSSVCNTVVTENVPVVCTITGNTSFCDGGSTELCTPVGAASYLWSTGASTRCITVAVAGNYAVTVTGLDGCSSVCNTVVTEGLPVVCTITGNTSFCGGGSTELCTPVGAASYLWSTGASTRCITVAVAGNYAVTVTGLDGCSSVCNTVVTENVPVVCTITGNTSFCGGGSTELCTPVGAASYLWSTGASTRCITVAVAGNYAVTVTSLDGCSSVCNTVVTEGLPAVCTITGNTSLCGGGSTELCTPVGAASYLWSTGASTRCITVAVAGNYAVTVTSLDGCSSVCNTVVTEGLPVVCTITGNTSFCGGGSTELCTPVGAASYLWSTGASTRCITVAVAGNYAVTVTGLDGCSSVCNTVVTENAPVICTITGNDCICHGESTQLCTTTNASSFLWSTGEVTSCIWVSAAGIYSVTVSDASGCSSVCSKTIAPALPPVITCPANVTISCDESTLPSNIGTATATNSCNLMPTITYQDMDMGGVYSIIRIWTATNLCGDSSTCIQTILVIDTIPPSVECPTNMAVPCADQVPPVDVSLVVGSDNCGGLVTVIHTGDVISDQTCTNSFTLTRSYLATDADGNTTSCAQTITVLDNTPPDILFVDPLLLDGDTLRVSCLGQDPTWDVPFFNEGSVLAQDDCAGAITVVFNEQQQGNGDCENGIINLYRLSWIAQDTCGNTDSVLIFLALIDTIPPVIYGVPADITVNCNNIPPLPEDLFAIDECLCACILLVEESVLVEGCQNGQVLVRSWTAQDQCGNQTTATQTITLVDDSGPVFSFLEPEMEGVENGTVLNYRCSEGGIPTFFDALNTVFVLDTGSCGGSYTLAFDVDILLADNCEALGFVEQRTYTWVAADECNNRSTMSVVVRLIDTEAPVFTGVPDTACLVSPWLNDIDVRDYCGEFTMLFQDFILPNACGDGVVIQRIYEAIDQCGNLSRDTSILIPNTPVTLSIEFTKPILANVETGDTLTLNCEAQNGQYTTFGVEDVRVEGACVGLTLSFSETVIASGDCLADGFIATVELRWTATDLCGNSGERVILVNVVDHTGPVFVDFLSEVRIGCDDELPLLSATDNCGGVTFVTTWDSIILSNCVLEYDIQRLVTATDACANTTTQRQIIHVGNANGPTFEGIVEVVCNDTPIAAVTAIDACSGQLVEVGMQADTLDSPCGGMVIERTWTAVDSCGNVSWSRQTVIINDTIPPVFVVPANSFIYPFLHGQYHVIYLSHSDLIFDLNRLDSNSIFVEDDCSEVVFIRFTADVVHTENCLDSGYVERRTYTWTATDFCGNAATLSFVVYIIDDVPPAFVAVPADTTIVCEALPAALLLTTSEPAHAVSVAFSESIVPGAVPGIFIVTRTWTATDACNNVTVYTQTITWIPDTLVECNIQVPDPVACNTHGVLICSDQAGSMDGSSFHWEVLGEECFIQGNPDSVCILIYIGWAPVELTLTVTDSFGCVSTCTATLDCEFIFDNSFYTTQSGMNPVVNFEAGPNTFGSVSINHLQNLYVYPNPAVGSVNLRFESLLEDEVTFSFMNLLGGLVAQGKIEAQKGGNTHQVDVSNLPEGSYLMQLKTRDETHTKVMVIMRND